MVITALMFPLLIMCVAFVVDVSMFFFKSIQVQRTADAAALAGVTRMPRTVDAQRLAVDIAKRNGYQNGINGVSVTVAPPPDTNKRREWLNELSELRAKTHTGTRGMPLQQLVDELREDRC